MDSIDRRSNLLLTLLYAGENPASTGEQRPTAVEGITRLEKLLFLLVKQQGHLAQAEPGDAFNFVPFRMGPWTGEVYDEVDFLSALGLVESRADGSETPADSEHEDELFDSIVLDKYEKDSVRPSDRMEVFDLTEAGRNKAMEIWSALSEERRREMIELKRRYNSMGLTQFLRYVYKNFPEYTTKSEIKDSLGL